jgi:hypothetical protein
MFMLIGYFLRNIRIEFFVKSSRKRRKAEDGFKFCGNMAFS